MATYAGRQHTVLIELSAGEERLYRLPPMTPGPVVVHVKHADVMFRTTGRPDPEGGPGGPAGRGRAVEDLWLSAWIRG